MKSKSKVTIIVSLILFITLLFFIWNYYLSLYEVEFDYDFTSSQLELNKIYKIQCTGVNALGQHLKFRDTNFIYSFEKGESLIKILPDSDKNTLIFTIVDHGEIQMILDSKYSLNPTRLRLSSKVSHEQ